MPSRHLERASLVSTKVFANSHGRQLVTRDLSYTPSTPAYSSLRIYMSCYKSVYPYIRTSTCLSIDPSIHSSISISVTGRCNQKHLSPKHPSLAQATL